MYKRQEYVNIAKAAGLSEAEFEACIGDEEQNARYEKVVQGGIDAGVTGTPSFFFNGVKVSAFKLEDFDEKLAPLLGAAMPEKDEAQPETEDTE